MNRNIRTAKNPTRKQWLKHRTSVRRLRWLRYQRELMTCSFTWISSETGWQRDPNDQANQCHKKYALAKQYR